jgi:hypothetical protein
MYVCMCVCECRREFYSIHSQSNMSGLCAPERAVDCRPGHTQPQQTSDGKKVEQPCTRAEVIDLGHERESESPSSGQKQLRAKRLARVDTHTHTERERERERERAHQGLEVARQEHQDRKQACRGERACG